MYWTHYTERVQTQQNSGASLSHIIREKLGNYCSHKSHIQGKARKLLQSQKSYTGKRSETTAITREEWFDHSSKVCDPKLTTNSASDTFCEGDIDED